MMRTAMTDRVLTGAERLAAASLALSGPDWMCSNRRAAEIMRACVLELGEILDAVARTRERLAFGDHGKKGSARIRAYLAQVDAFAVTAIDFVVAIAIRAGAQDLASLGPFQVPVPRSRDLPLEVLDEIGSDAALARHLFETSGAWKRAHDRLQQVGLLPA